MWTSPVSCPGDAGPRDTSPARSGAKFLPQELGSEVMALTRKIAFIGSHSVRKTNAVHSFAAEVGRSGRSVEVGREVVRFNPLGRNEGATAEAQLWTLTHQIQQELELRGRADVLVLDRAVVDNFAYFLRATAGEDPFDIRPLVMKWSKTYDLYVRLRPDVALKADGVRSTNVKFRKEIEKILDLIIPQFVDPEQLVELKASEVNESFDWSGLLEQLCGPTKEEHPEPKPVTLTPTLFD